MTAEFKRRLLRASIDVNKKVEPAVDQTSSGVVGIDSYGEFIQQSSALIFPLTDRL